MIAEEFKIACIPLKNKFFCFALHLMSHSEETENVVQEVYLNCGTGEMILENRKEGLGPVLYPTGNNQEDWLEIKRYYKTFNVRQSECYNLSLQHRNN